MARLEPMSLCYMGRGLTIRLYIISCRILFSFMFYFRNICIFQISLEHSRSFRITPGNTIKEGTRRYVEPNWFNASLKPSSHSCTFSSRNIYISLIITLSLSPFVSLSGSLLTSLKEVLHLS